jgi:hypothetical protein
MKTSWWQIISRWKNRWQPSESIVLGGAALFVGLTSGAGVWLFKRFIDLAHLAKSSCFKRGDCKSHWSEKPAGGIPSACIRRAQ